MTKLKNKKFTITALLHKILNNAQSLMYKGTNFDNIIKEAIKHHNQGGKTMPVQNAIVTKLIQEINSTRAYLDSISGLGGGMVTIQELTVKLHTQIYNDVKELGSKYQQLLMKYEEIQNATKIPTPVKITPQPKTPKSKE